MYFTRPPVRPGRRRRRSRACAAPRRGRAWSAHSRHGRSRSRRSPTSSTSASEMRFCTPPTSTDGHAGLRQVDHAGGNGEAHGSAVSIRDIGKRDPRLAERQAAVVGRHRLGLDQRDAARAERGVQAAREDGVEEAAAAAGDRVAGRVPAPPAPPTRRARRRAWRGTAPRRDRCRARRPGAWPAPSGRARCRAVIANSDGSAGTAHGARPRLRAASRPGLRSSCAASRRAGRPRRRTSGPCCWFPAR